MQAYYYKQFQALVILVTFFSMAWNHILHITGRGCAKCDFNFAFEQEFCLIRTILLSLLALDISYQGFSKENYSLIPAAHLVFIIVQFEYCVPNRTATCYLPHIFHVSNLSKRSPDPTLRCSGDGNNSHRAFKRDSNSCFAGSKTISLPVSKK